MSKVLAVLLELKECSDYWSEYAVPIGIHERIDEAIAELLAQPEPFKPDWVNYRQGVEDGIDKVKQTESEPETFRGLRLSGDSYSQEPVAWKDRTYGNLHHINWGDSIPLYTAPPKREPLSEATIAHYLERLGSNTKWDAGFLAGIEWTEKAHGIGVDDV